MRRMSLTAGLALCAVFGTAMLNSPSRAQQADATIASDGRQILYLTEEQRTHVRGEMRNFLEGVQGLTYAIADEDRAMIAELAAGMGPHGPGPGMDNGQGMQRGNGMGRGHGDKPMEGMQGGQGMGKMGGMGMMRDAPDEFFEYARPLRQNFKAISEMAPTADMKDIQRALSENLLNCVACHDTFTARDKN
ncbi:MAG: hypothetical protein CMK07_14710 [Ponticaulis sp.]|nr:hypothetical protein [Ponticaulis sp.]